MLKAICVFLLTAAIGLLPTFSAQAQFPCGAYPDITKRLHQRHHEKLERKVKLPDGRQFELFVSPGGSYTILQVYPNGGVCAVSAGHVRPEWPA